jgi:hypothetical protein
MPCKGKKRGGRSLAILITDTVDTLSFMRVGSRKCESCGITGDKEIVVQPDSSVRKS